MIECDKTNFEYEVLEAKGTVLVDFYGNGCVPCESLMPKIKALSEKYGEKIKFCKLNISSARRLAIGQKVLGVPVIAIYQNGQKIDELVKEDATADATEEMLLKYI